MSCRINISSLNTSETGRVSSSYPQTLNHRHLLYLDVRPTWQFQLGVSHVSEAKTHLGLPSIFNSTGSSKKCGSQRFFQPHPQANYLQQTLQPPMVPFFFGAPDQGFGCQLRIAEWRRSRRFVFRLERRWMLNEVIAKMEDSRPKI